MIKKEIDIEESILCNVYSEPNGIIGDRNWETYWILESYFLKANSYDPTNKYQFTIKDGNSKSTTYQIHNIMYEFDTKIKSEIEGGKKKFYIDDNNIEIYLIDKLPNHINVKEINKCKCRARNVKIKNVLE